MRLTTASQEQGEALWDEIEKSASVVPVSLPAFEYGPPPRAGLVFDYAGVKIASGGDPRETMQKLAGVWDSIRGILGTAGRSAKAIITGGEEVTRGLGGIPLSKPRESLTALETAQLGVLGAGAAGILGAGVAGVDAVNDRRKYHQIRMALHGDPWFENHSDKSKIDSAFEMMKKYAPTIAKDPIVTRSFVRTMVEGDENSMNLSWAQELMEAEKKYRESGNFTEDLFDLRRAVRSGLRPFGYPSGGKKSS